MGELLGEGPVGVLLRMTPASCESNSKTWTNEGETWPDGEWRGTLGTRPAEGNFLVPLFAMGEAGLSAQARAGLPFWKSLEPRPAVSGCLTSPLSES